MSAEPFSQLRQVNQQHQTMLTQCTLYSVNEAGLYDYIICNEDVDSAGKELKAVAERALQGLVGRPADQPPAAASAASAPEPASKVWHCGGCSTVLVLLAFHYQHLWSLLQS